MISEFECVDIGGIIYPVVKRRKGSQHIDECPFCGQQHLHSVGEGHRYPTCGSATNFIIINGKMIPKERGYIIKDY